MTWMSRYKGIGLLVVALVFSVASGSKGDRAESGHCPEGEVCSPDTPSGLRFQGPGFADALLDFDLHTTAVGGQQLQRRWAPEGFVPVGPIGERFLHSSLGYAGSSVGMTAWRGSVLSFRPSRRRVEESLPGEP